MYIFLLKDDNIYKGIMSPRSSSDERNEIRRFVKPHLKIIKGCNYFICSPITVTQELMFEVLLEMGIQRKDFEITFMKELQGYSPKKWINKSLEKLWQDQDFIKKECQKIFWAIRNEVAKNGGNILGMTHNNILESLIAYIKDDWTLPQKDIRGAILYFKKNRRRIWTWRIKELC